MRNRGYLVPFSGKPEDVEQMKQTMLGLLKARENQLGTLTGPAKVISFAAILVSLKSLSSFFF